MTRRFVQEELNSQVVKFRGENRFHQFAARQCSYHLSVYNLVYRIKLLHCLKINIKNVAIPISNRIYSIHPLLRARNTKR